MSKRLFTVTRKNAAIAVGGAVVIGAAGFSAVVFFGAANVSARAPHWGINTAILHSTFKSSVAARADAVPPADFEDPGRVVLGAQHYENVCSKCHGGPELGQNPIALSMRPRPQHLAAVVDQFTDPELFYILEQGVRFSAMPAWPTLKNSDEIWSTVAFLRELPEMTGAEYSELVRYRDPAPEMPYGDPGETSESFVGIKAGPMEEYFYAAPSTEWLDIAMSETPVARCAACHGSDGTGAVTNGYAPNLTIQSADYITSTLHAYATGERKSGIMQVVAAGLSDGQIDALARYYDEMPAKQVMLDETASLEMITQGEEIALNGQPDLAVEACVTCHGSQSPEGGLSIPTLSGQSPKYIAHQLRMFRDDEGRGASGVYNPMEWQAHALADQDIAALAAYFASRLPNRDIARPEEEVDLANAEGIVTRVCSECHTATGQGSESGQIPNLTLQTPAYINHQLHSFRLTYRENTQMQQTARRLEDDDIRDLAAYFGGPDALPSVGEEADPLLAAAGEVIAMNGLPDDDVPSCLTCHGSDQAASVPVIARLHGQNPVYLKSRLDYFAEDSADLPGLNPMHPIASAMDEDQRAAVANWFAAQEPLPKVQ